MLERGRRFDAKMEIVPSSVSTTTTDNLERPNPPEELFGESSNLCGCQESWVRYHHEMESILLITAADRRQVFLSNRYTPRQSSILSYL